MKNLLKPHLSSLITLTVVIIILIYPLIKTYTNPNTIQSQQALKTDASHYLDQIDQNLSDNQIATASLIQTASDLAPFSSNIMNRIGTILTNSNQYIKALPYFKQAVLNDSQNIDAHFNLVKTYRHIHRHQDALKELHTILTTISDSKARTNAQNQITELENPIAQWTTTTHPKTNLSVTHPQSWVPQFHNNSTILTNPNTQFTLTIITDTLKPYQTKEDWLQTSPLQFSGNIEASKPAAIPNYSSTATYYRDPNETLTLELLLTDDNHIIHLKATPADEQLSMQFFGPLINSFSFNN